LAARTVSLLDWSIPSDASSQPPGHIPPGKHPSWGTRSAEDFVKQLKQECEEAATRRKEARRREQLLTNMIAQRQKRHYAAGAFVVLLAVLLLGIVYTRPPSAWPFVMFAGLVSAGATGALIRMVLWEPGETDARRSLLLGSVAGLVVGLAYLIPQWVGAPEVLAPKADTAVTTGVRRPSGAVGRRRLRYGIQPAAKPGKGLPSRSATPAR
jgi:hypothetical protein